MQTRRNARERIVGSLAFASLVCLAACGGGTPPAALVLAVSGTGVTSTQPNPCEIDVTFADTAVAQTSTATLVLTNPGKTAVDLSTTTTSLNSVFTANSKGLNSALAPAATLHVPLTFKPKVAQASISSFVVNLTPTAGTCAEITVSLAGSGVVFQLTVNPINLDLGNTVLDTTVTQTVSLINDTDDVVSGLTATLGGTNPTDFSVSDLPSWLDAGATATVSVNFRPAAAIPVSHANITFAAAEGQQVNLPVSGEPLQSPITLDPSPLNLGYTFISGFSVGCTVASNVTTSTVTITGTQNFDTDGNAFAISQNDGATPPNPSPIPVTIPGGGTAKLCFTLTPQQLAATQYTGQVTFTTDGPSATYPTLALTGWGGGPVLSCSPSTALDFGQTLEGTPSTISVTCTNIGTASGMLPNLILKPSVTPAVFTASFDAANPYPVGVGLAPNQSAQIDVTYTPTGTAGDQGTLTIGSNAGQGQGLQIPLSGQGVNLGPCQFSITPSSVDFGNIAGDGGSLPGAFTVMNTGTNACAVEHLAIANDAHGDFRLVSTSIAPDPQTGWITIPASSGVDGGLTVNLAFTPKVAGTTSAQLNFEISDPASPYQSVFLSGSSGAPCVVVVPQTLNFGTVGQKAAQSDGGTSDGGVNDAGPQLCPSAARTLTVFNGCVTSSTLEDIELEFPAGAPTAQFSAPAGPAVPQLLQSTPLAYAFTFQPTVIGSHSAQVVFTLDGGDEALAVVTGATTTASLQTDSFVVGVPKVDFLFVRDVSDDLNAEPLLAAAIPNFLDAGAGVDYRLAVTTTDDNPQYADADYGRLLPCQTCFAQGPGPIIVTPSSIPDGGTSPDPVSVFVDLLGAGGGGNRNTGSSADKHMMASLFDALTRDATPGLDFFRPGVYFAVINESGDLSPDGSYVIQPETWYQSFFAAWFPGPSAFSWSYISPGETVTGTGFTQPTDVPVQIEALITATGGFAFNTQDPAWTQALLTLWGSVAKANLRFTLSTVPPNGTTGLSVTVNGAPVVPPAWTYNATGNAILFQGASTPNLGDTIQVSYPIGCP